MSGNVEKVPCSSCGFLILPTTAERTGGLCRPCQRRRDTPAAQGEGRGTGQGVRSPKRQISKADLETILAAWDEYWQKGQSTVRCDACGGTIEFTALSETAWAHSCPCGKFSGTARGL